VQISMSLKTLKSTMVCLKFQILCVCYFVLSISLNLHPMKLLRLIKICLNETYGRVQVDKHLSDMLPIKNSLKQGDALSRLLFTFTLEYTIRRVQTN